MAPPNIGGGGRLVASLLVLVSFTSKFTNILGLIGWQFTTLFLYSYMWLLLLARDFFSRFLGSRNYKIQIVARVGRRSAVVLSGIVEASYSRFFIGQGFDRSRSSFRCLSSTFKNYH